jgi:hypothetical protein
MDERPTHINNLRILVDVETDPGWFDGIVVRPDAPFADEGRQFVVFRNWDGKSNYWGSGIYDLTLEQAMGYFGVRPKERA